MKPLQIMLLFCILCACGCSSMGRDVTGVSLVAGDGILYLGDHTPGLWHDKCTKNYQDPEERTGFGFKFDILFGHTVRPMGCWWQAAFWNTGDLRIKDVDFSCWDELFGPELAAKLRNTDPNRWKYDVYNPWYGKHWGVLRLPKFLPSFYFSLSTPWKSLYIGNKSYRVDARTDTLPFPGKDFTWTNKKDEERCFNEEPDTYYMALCPSGSIRSSRK